MRIFTVALFVAVSFFYVNDIAYAATEVFGTIDSDTTWTLTNSPYVIASNLSIPTGITLTIEPGSIIKMGSGAAINVSGTLMMGSPTETASVVMTSIKDDSVGGDTNGDGTLTTPQSGDYLGIIVSSGELTINHAILRYGGAPVYIYGTVSNLAGTTTLTDVEISHGGYYGVLHWSGTTVVTRANIFNMTFAAVRHLGGGSFIIRASRLLAPYGVYNEREPDTSITDARHNWWGDASGPGNAFTGGLGTGSLTRGGVDYAPWLTNDPFNADTPTTTCTVDCNSSVLFLPGIMGSRLFEESSACGIFNSEKERWVSRSDCDHARLALDANGKSIHPLYTKEEEGGTIDDAYSANLYQSFINDLDTWKSDDHLIADYALIPYDWRLSLPDILQNGATTTNGLSYSINQGFANSYIYRKLVEMASSSRTGKVTIVAHSNGGLVTKALIQKLKETDDPLHDKIDNVILIAVPQSGTPEAVSNILHGDQIGPMGFVMEAKRLRELTQNMPGAYHLLPSTAYFGGTAASVTTPVVTFIDGTSTQQFIAAYGNEITTPAVLNDFLLGIDGRIQPVYNNLENPTKLRANLLSYAQDIHQQIDDAWEFSTATKVYQIAGWGEKTLATIAYRSVPDCNRVEPITIAGRTSYYCTLWGSKLTFDPKEVIDGDGTVVTPSALAVSTSSERVTRYWVDLKTFNDPVVGVNRVHKDILEIPQLRKFIRGFISQSSSTPTVIISTSTPPSTSDNRFTFTLHSPLTLEFTDTLGRHVGPSTSTQDEIDSSVPGARYKRYGEVQLLSIPSTATGTLTLRGVSSGSFTLDITEENGDTDLATTSFEGILSATSTVATMLINPTFSPVTSGALVIDIDGDGTTDETLYAKEGATVFPDSTPPEARMGFSTTTKNLTIQGFDHLGSTTMQTTATGTIIADQSGNILHIPFLGMMGKNRRTVLSFDTLVYNGSTTIIATTTVKYKWKTDASGKFTMFAAYIKTGTTTTEVHYRPKKNITIVMTKPQDIDDSDTDEDCDARPIKTKLSGMIIPSVVTNQGKIEVNY